MIAGRFNVPADHPCLPGHFPGRPLVPAVLLLDEVLGLIGPAGGIASVKFLRPVLPGDEVEVSVSGAQFSCIVRGVVSVRGRLP